MKRVRLKPGREKPVHHRHPWIFSGAVDRWEGDPKPGDLVEIVDAKGTWMARGFAHPTCNLCVRVMTWTRSEQVDDAFFARRIRAAVALRDSLAHAREGTNCCRLVFSESDGLSGLVVDRYDKVLSVRVASLALAPFLPSILDQLTAATGVRSIHVAVDRDAESREGLKPDMLPPSHEPPPGPFEILENGSRFEVDVTTGQKTGYYLDQRDNRRRVASYAAGRRVLSAYCYTGGFEVAAAKAGATSIVGIDASRDAVARARRNMALNGITAPVDYIAGDVPETLRTFRDEGQTFDLLILDPPRFAVNRAQTDKALRAYKDIHLLAMKLAAPGGLLVTFSCSGLIPREALTRSLAWAAEDAGATVRVLETLGQPHDHPVLASFPEGEYLCGLICSAG